MPPTKPGRRKYRLIVQAEHHTVPPIIRIRHVLKRLLRSFGFRCLEIVDITHGELDPCTVTDAAASTGDAASQPPSDTPSAG